MYDAQVISIGYIVSRYFLELSQAASELPEDAGLTAQRAEELLAEIRAGRDQR